ncbi:MAG: succinate dehydrogenase [Tranquillimonas sp.]|jgi:fumarate reductase subunit C
MLDLRLYMAQRLSAMVMVPLVLGHLAVMVYAIRGGLSAGEILGRTQGSLLWFAFYGTLVAAVAVHAAIGLAVILHETLVLSRRAAHWIMGAAFALFLGMGARAVWTVTLA